MSMSSLSVVLVILSVLVLLSVLVWRPLHKYMGIGSRHYCFEESNTLYMI